MNNSRILPFGGLKRRKKKGVQMRTLITSRTTADAVREDPYLMEEITDEQIEQEGLENGGNTSTALQRYRAIRESLGIIDPYSVDDDEDDE